MSSYRKLVGYWRQWQRKASTTTTPSRLMTEETYSVVPIEQPAPWLWGWMFGVSFLLAAHGHLLGTLHGFGSTERRKTTSRD